jgi:hypothetical protein
VIEGMWKQKEATDGTYNFHDLLVAHEILDVTQVNKNVVSEWLKKRRE